MKRSESDRFIADPSEDEPDVSAEVYLIVSGEGRRAIAIGWGYLAVAIAILATAVAIVMRSLVLGGGQSSSAPTTAVATDGSLETPTSSGFHVVLAVC